MANAYDLKRWAGNVFVQERASDDTLLRGERDMGHCTVVTMAAPSTEQIEEKGRGLDNYDTVIYAESGSLEQEIQITTRSDNAENAALAMFGNITETTQTAGTDGTPTDLTLYSGEWVDTGKRNLDPETPPLVVEDAEVTPQTYTEGEDYEVDYKGGRIRAIVGGDIADAQTVKLTRTWLELAISTIEANRNMSKNVRLRIVGQDQIDKVYGEWIIDKAQIRPSGDVSKITEPGGNNFQEYAFTGKIITVDGKQWREVRYS